LLVISIFPLLENYYASGINRLRLPLSYLPGSTPKMMINADIHRSHAVTLDLEDAVAVTKKDHACLFFRNALRQIEFCGTERMVRFNQLPLGLTLNRSCHTEFTSYWFLNARQGMEVKQVNKKIPRFKETELPM
jgi:hypothetical protein